MSDIMTWALFLGALTGFWAFVLGAWDMLLEAAERLDNWATHRMLKRVAWAIYVHERLAGRPKQAALGFASTVMGLSLELR